MNLHALEESLGWFLKVVGYCRQWSTSIVCWEHHNQLGTLEKFLADISLRVLRVVEPVKRVLAVKIYLPRLCELLVHLQEERNWGEAQLCVALRAQKPIILPQRLWTGGIHSSLMFAVGWASTAAISVPDSVCTTTSSMSEGKNLPSNAVIDNSHLEC